MSAPYFSVVIPTYNRLPMLLRVLDALDRQADAPEREVIVVDDGSTDGTREALQGRGGVVFRSQQNGGPGRARNHGVTLAGGRFVIFIGDDTVPEPQFLREHARVHGDSGDDPLIAGLGYTGWPAEDRVTAFMDYINDYGLQFGYKLIRDGETVPYNFFYTSNISIARDLLAAHPFDTTFPAAACESDARSHSSEPVANSSAARSLKSDRRSSTTVLRTRLKRRAIGFTVLQARSK